MPPEPAIATSTDLGTLFTAGATGRLTDAQLLDRVLDGDPAAGGPAFEAIVRRHGPMVRASCRRMLGDSHEVDDAVQATFLVLVLKARSIRSADALGPWLHGVAVRVSRRAREQVRGRAEVPLSADPPATGRGDGHPLALAELRSVIDEELARLPERHRAPVVLCCLEGRSHEAAAEALGWPTGTVAGRLSRARAQLRDRLARRGFAPAVVVAGLDQLAPSPADALPASLEAAAVRLALAASLGRSALAGLGAGTAAATLARSALRATLRLELGRLAASAALLATIAAGAGLAAARVGPPDPAGPAQLPPGSSSARSSFDLPPALDGPPPAPRPTDRLGDPLPDAAVARLGTARFRHKDVVRAMAASPDGSTLASAGSDGIRIWDVTTGGQRLHLREANRLTSLFGSADTLVNVLEFASDGRTLAVSGRPWGGADAIPTPPSSLRLLNVGRGSARWGRSIDNSGTTAIAFAPDNKSLAVGGTDGVVFLLDRATGKDLRWLEGHGQPVSALAFSPDGSSLLTGSRDGTARLWDVASGEPGTAFEVSGPVNAVVFVSDSRLMVAGTWEVRTFDRADGRMLASIDLSERFGAGCFDAAVLPDGPAIAVAFYDHVRVLDAETLDVLHEHRIPGFNHDVVPVSGGSELALAGHTSAAIRLLDVKSGRVRPEESHRGDVRVLAFAPDGRTIASADAVDPTIRLWDAATGRQRSALPRGGGPIQALAFSPADSTLLALGSASGSLTLRIVAGEGGSHGLISRVIAWVGALAFGADGRTLLALTHDREHRLEIYRFDGIHADNSPFAGKRSKVLVQCEATLPGPEPNSYSPPRIDGAVFSPDLSRLAFAYEGSIYLIDAATGRQLHRLPVPDDPVVSLAFSPDGSTLLSGGWGRVLRLWDVSDGSLERSFPPFGEGQQINAVAFAPDGRRIAAGIGWKGGFIDVIDLDSGGTRRLSGHNCYTASLAFSPDGKALASGLRDATVLLWDPSLGIVPSP